MSCDGRMQAGPSFAGDLPPGLGRRDFLRLAAGATGVLIAGSGTGCTSRVSACKSVAPNPFVDAGRPLLISVEGEDVAAMLRAGLERLGGVGPLRSFGRDALLKANYIARQPYPITTAADTIVAVAQALKAAGFSRTTLFEAHGTRLAPGMAPDANARQLGVLERVAQGGVDAEMRDFFDSREFRLVRNPAWPIAEPVAVHRALHEAGVVVSLPVLKRHEEARLTCALKLHFGSVAMADRLIAHKRASQGGLEYFDQRLVHFADAVRPQLNIVDARGVLARSGPTLSAGGEIVRGVNRLILCGDMVATDAYCAQLLAKHDPTFSPEMIAPQLKHAAALGLGTADLDAVTIVEVRV